MRLSTVLNAPAAPSTMAEKLSVSLQTLVVGMLVVFAVLTIIMLVVMLVGSFFKSSSKNKKEKKEEKAPAPAIPVEETVAEPTVSEDEGAIVAAITAAVAVYLEEPVGSFRVVSFRKTATRTPWNKK